MFVSEIFLFNQKYLYEQQFRIEILSTIFINTSINFIHKASVDLSQSLRMLRDFLNTQYVYQLLDNIYSQTQNGIKDHGK